MFRLLGAGLLALALPAAALASAVVESLKGGAHVGAAALRQGERVFPGSTLSTAAGAQVLLRFDDGMQVVLGEASHFRLVDFRYAKGGPNDRAVFDLLAGAARVTTGDVARNNPAQFFLRTPQASFGVEGDSDFAIVLADAAYVSVSRGTVVASNRAGTVSLRPGPTVSIASSGASPAPVAALPPRVASALDSLDAAAAARAEAPAPSTAVTAAPAEAPAPPPARYVFVGAAAGRSDIDEGVTRGLITSGSVKGEGTGFKLFGGYQFHRNLGVEAAFVDLGEAKYEGSFTGGSLSGAPVVGGKLKVTGINLAALGRLPLGERFALFAKIGLFLWEAEASDTTSGVPFSAKTDGGDPSFGIGASYNVTRNVAVRAEGEMFRIDKDNASLLSLGVVFSF